MKGVYYALVLTIRNPGKISIILSRTKQRECPVGTLYTYLNYAVQPPMEVFTPFAAFGIDRCIIHIGVGLRRCSFRQDGQFPGASNREASDSAGLHALFMSLCNVYFNKNVGCRSPEP